jgi:hypothetical protein
VLIKDRRLARGDQGVLGDDLAVTTASSRPPPARIPTSVPIRATGTE